MKKKLTLNETWNQCLKMWKWIDGEVKSGTQYTVGTLKSQWLGTNFPAPLRNDCFFCEYGKQSEGDEFCNKCPGRLVSKKFDCMCTSYDYHDKPHAFYRKLVELNKKRLAKKK